MTAGFVVRGVWFSFSELKTLSMVLPPENDFFCFPGWKKDSKWNILPTEEVKQKTAKALKGIKIDKFNNFLSRGKNVLYTHIASNREDFEGDWSLNM